MQKVDLKTFEKDLSYLFKECQLYIPDAIREGSIGQVLVDDLDNPQSAVLAIPGFKLSIFGGDVNTPAIRAYIEELPFFAMLLFGSKGWDGLLRGIHPGKWIVMPRYGFSSESLNADHLQALKAKLSDEFRIEKIDLARAQEIMGRGEKDRFTGDQLFGYDSPEDFMTRGLGYCVLLGDEMVSIAAAGATCAKGIEVQINTQKDYEGRGLGTAVAAALILDCLAQGIDPNWDAATKESAGLAKKLGYSPTGEYPMYVFLKYKGLVKFRNGLRKMMGRDKKDSKTLGIA